MSTTNELRLALRDAPGSEWHDESIYEAMGKVEAVLAKAEEAENGKR